ncbi:MAG: fused MFS/spermidine synthase [Candidatus Dormiibacterota bacterium]
MPPAPNNSVAPAGNGRKGQGPLLLLLAFVGGVTSLGLEISASRLLAPFFGTSTYIWGALIGLILLYLTLGYYIGGWAADRWPRADYLFRLTAIASALVLLIPLVSRPVLLFSQSSLQHLQAGAFIGALVAVILIFAPSVILLGMVSPYVIRLRVDNVGVAGRAAGLVYAISTAGSILGAFLPAFWWIPSFGTRATIYGLGAVMLLMSVVGMITVRYARTLLVAAISVVPLVGAALPIDSIRPPADGTAIYESDSEYGYIQVVERGSEHDLILNEGQAIHSIYDPGRQLTRGPWDYFSLAPLFGHRQWTGQKPERVLIIGLAGGTVARQITAAYGPVPIDGVEIDPRIIDVGRKYFDMNEPNLNAIAADGRYFLDTTDNQYDIIAVDAYRQPYIPFQLTTKEFFQSARQHLKPNGVVVVNVGRAPNDYRLVDAVSGTLLAVFPEVYQQDASQFLNSIVYATNQPTQPSEVAANFNREASLYPPLVAAVMQEASGNPPPKQVTPHLPIYTDDLAPVERLVDNIIYRYVTTGN